LTSLDVICLDLVLNRSTRGVVAAAVAAAAAAAACCWLAVMTWRTSQFLGLARPLLIHELNVLV
jgi:hypothetical protein